MVKDGAMVGLAKDAVAVELAKGAAVVELAKGAVAVAEACCRCLLRWCLGNHAIRFPFSSVRS